MNIDSSHEVIPQVMLLSKTNPINASQNKSEKSFHKMVNDISKNSLLPQQCKGPQSPKNQPAKTDEQAKLRKQTEVLKKNQISKTLIAEMVNKISAKNVTESLYPVSNQTLNLLISQIDSEIQDIIGTIQRRKVSLSMDPTNQHIKKQLQGYEKSLNQVRNIKELYIFKVDCRNKIEQLQSLIIDLKRQNRELKVKIARGIEKIESHIHYLPCEKQKELIEEVNKGKMELATEREMRINLEVNIENIVMNFKRFYVEADNARKIVVQKLKEIEARDADINSKLEILSSKQKSLRDYEKIKENEFQKEKEQLGMKNRLSSGDNYSATQRPDNRQSYKYTKRIKDSKGEFKQSLEFKSKEFKQFKDSRQIKDSKQVQESKEFKYSKQFHNSKEFKDSKELVSSLGSEVYVNRSTSVINLKKVSTQQKETSYRNEVENHQDYSNTGHKQKVKETATPLRNTKQVPGIDSDHPKALLEEQIQKMRSNQQNFARTPRRK